MVHYLKQEEKYRSRTLWAEAFPEDSAEFQDYYYREKTQDNEILVMEKEERIVSMLHRNPYILTAAGREWRSDYIVGVATAKDSRRKGYMTKLMVKALTDMRKEYMPFTFLMPVSEELYRPFGFTNIFCKAEWELNSKGISSLEEIPFSNENADDIAQWINQWLKKRYEVYALRNRGYMERLKKEIESEKGIINLLYENANLAGIEASWGVNEKESRLLFCEEKYRKETEREKVSIMGRILHLPEFIRAIRLEEGIAASEMGLILEVEDRQLEENSGKWIWNLNKTSSKIEKVNTGIKYPELRMSIQDLTAWLTGYRIPESAKPYRGIIRPLKGVFLDEIV